MNPYRLASQSSVCAEEFAGQRCDHGLGGQFGETGLLAQVPPQQRGVVLGDRVVGEGDRPARPHSSPSWTASGGQAGPGRRGVAAGRAVVAAGAVRDEGTVDQQRPYRVEQRTEH